VGVAVSVGATVGTMVGRGVALGYGVTVGGGVGEGSAVAVGASVALGAIAGVGLSLVVEGVGSGGRGAAKRKSTATNPAATARGIIIAKTAANKRLTLLPPSLTPTLLPR
jgi:hypothetical protein